MSGLKPIVGEIRAQVLNDNFSYINQKAEEAGTDPELEQRVDALETELASHLAEKASDDVHGLLSGGKLIEESGSNANGHYIKLSNGYVFAYRRVNISLQSLDEGVNYLTYTLPISIPDAISFLNLSVLTGAQSIANLVTVINGPLVDSTGTSWSRLMIEREPTTAGNTVYIELFAIGRWK